MYSFKKADIGLPLGTVWLMNTIAEYKGKQELYEKQSPQVLKTLLETSLIESAESSNRIEGVIVERDRLKPLVIGKSKPRDRSEEEVAGYRKALELIHKKHKGLRITPATIQHLHKLCQGESWDGGQRKERDNDIIRKHPDGRVEIIFKPVSARKTPRMIEQLCLIYEHSLSQLKYPELYAVACLVLDFLSIHPFRDGNGRVSRLLTLLGLYHHGFTMGRYISLEKVVEESKESYYESLNKSSQGWHEARHDMIPWVNYFLGTVLGAYKKFEEQAQNLKSPRGTKTAMVISAVENQFGEFSISDIERACPAASRALIKKVLLRLQKEHKVGGIGKGQAAKWKRMDSIQ